MVEPETRIDQFTVQGTDAPFIHVLLDESQPYEEIEAEPGSMAVMDGDIDVKTTFQGVSGIVGRFVTGESFAVATYRCKPGKSGMVTFAAPNPGGVELITVRQGHAWWVQQGGFICGANLNIKAKIPRSSAALFGGEGIFMQYLSKGDGPGHGIAYVDGGGTIMSRNLKEGQTIEIDTGCIVAFEDTVQYSSRFVPFTKKELKERFMQTVFGGEGLFLATLTGPGRCLIESLPHARRRGRMQGKSQEGAGAAFFENLNNLFTSLFGQQK